MRISFKLFIFLNIFNQAFDPVSGVFTVFLFKMEFVISRIHSIIFFFEYFSKTISDNMFSVVYKQKSSLCFLDVNLWLPGFLLA